MQPKYNSPDEITDEATKRQFAICTEVVFWARPSNFIEHRSVTFGDLYWELPLRRVLPLIGITPQMLRPVFNPQQERVLRHFPFNRSWFGLNRNRYTIVTVELPPTIDTYDQLGSFPLAYRPFQEFAKILGKSIKVMREVDGTGYLIITAHPTGEIVKAD